MARRSAESGLNGKVLTARRSDRFLDGLKDATGVTFVSHVHPDPDSLGSMMGLAHLVETCLGKPTRLTRDGLISRAENRAMVELLDLDLVPIEKVDLAGRRSRRHGGQPAEHRPAQPARGRPPLRRHRPPRHARRSRRRAIRGRPPQPRGDLLAGHQLPDGAEHRRAAGPGDRPAVRHRDGAERLSARGQPAGRRRPALPLPAGRQGPARPHPQRPAAAEPFRVHPAGAAKLVHLRPAHHQLGRTNCRSRSWPRRWSIS